MKHFLIGILIGSAAILVAFLGYSVARAALPPMSHAGPTEKRQYVKCAWIISVQRFALDFETHDPLYPLDPNGYIVGNIPSPCPRESE